MDELFLNQTDCIKMIDLEDIYYFTKLNGKVVAVSKDTQYIINTSLYNVSELLGHNKNFFRSHKSFIINVSKIDSISKYTDKTYNISFKGIKQKAFITIRNFKILCKRINLV